MGRYLLRRHLLRISLTLLPLLSLWGESRGPLEIRHNPPAKGEPTVNALTPRKDLRSEFHFDYPFEITEKVDEFIQIYSTEDKIAYLQRALDRSRPFSLHIKRTIEEKQLPSELFYLALVESAFRVNAVSRSGATGLWQFMMNSIDPYDITVDEWRDDRRDFWRSTEGALEKLLYNYEKTGNWDLALAAYNCGLNGLRRTMVSSGVYDYWELTEQGLLPYETSRYLPKFLAMTTICSYGGRYGLVSGWDEFDEWERIELDRSLDLKLLAQESGLDYGILALGNAELIYHVTPPADSGYSLKIPASYADSLSSILEASDSAFMEFYRYSIRTGDTLSELSDHYNVPLSLIYRYNEHLSARFLRPGQTVIIPALVDVPPYRSGETEPQDFSDTYIVREGDSLWSISGRYEISPELLASRNRLPVDGILNIGMKLSVPVLE